MTSALVNPSFDLEPLKDPLQTTASSGTGNVLSVDGGKMTMAKRALEFGNEPELFVQLLLCSVYYIAHALEKTKYPDSDIYWEDFDNNTYQEIAGTSHSSCFAHEVHGRSIRKPWSFYTPGTIQSSFTASICLIQSSTYSHQEQA
ncbi:hypothetical protein Bca52824_094687 [Brassica carinata]|uniref:Sucrose synthase first GT-B domain-containing protein n=1 Tax=Brassica carinata TaxID=52824 RepID=A0A8X7TIV9_BRACI|nr:hypothetical protein Bca52824_094687 [Brassica carinata]